MVIEQFKGGASQKSQVGYDIELTTSGAILTPERITSPMIGIFGPRPMSPNEADPSLLSPFGLVLTGKGVAGFKGGFAASFLGAPALDCHDDPGKREVDGHGLHIAQDQASPIDSLVARRGLDKRGLTHRLHLTVAQLPIQEKSNEIPAFQPLLRQLPLEGSLITADAMHCQQETARFVTQELGADYLFGLKGNQSGVLDRAQQKLPQRFFSPGV